MIFFQAGSIDQLNSEEMEELMAECEINDEGNINYESKNCRIGDSTVLHALVAWA